MAHIKIYSCLVILIISANGILVIEGRHLKPAKDEEFNCNKVQQQPSLNAGDLQHSRADGAGLPVAEEKVRRLPQVASRSQRNGSYKPESVNDLRPTAPGNSPGAGHSFTEHGFDTRSAAYIPQSTTPTGPGHSPGGGHSKQDQGSKPNV